MSVSAVSLVVVLVSMLEDDGSVRGDQLTDALAIRL